MKQLKKTSETTKHLPSPEFGPEWIDTLCNVSKWINCFNLVAGKILIMNVMRLLWCVPQITVHAECSSDQWYWEKTRQEGMFVQTVDINFVIMYVIGMPVICNHYKLCCFNTYSMVLGI